MAVRNFRHYGISFEQASGTSHTDSLIRAFDA